MTKKELKNIETADELTEFLLYSSPDGKTKVEVFLRDETVWLPQKRIAELFGVDRTVVTKHIKNIYNEQELAENTTCAKIAQVVNRGFRGEVEEEIDFYNLDMIISVGYRVNSAQATQFRVWATEQLRQLIVKGFVLDDERLKNGRYFGKDYFRELLERVRSIRASERRIYQQITDIFAECSIDYDRTSETTREFFATVQNKFHYAICGHTAAEIIYNTADASKPLMGLKTFKNAPDGRVLKSDVSVAKNYLTEDEIKGLERTIFSFFDYIEGVIERRHSFTMAQFAESVDKFLTFNEFRVLTGKGFITKDNADDKAYAEYEMFNKTQKIESDFDKQVKKLLKKD